MLHSADIARHKTGEIISKGVLFLAATGAAAGPLNGGTTAEFNFSYEWFEGVKIGKVFVFRIGAGAIAGAAGGSTVGYAGGAEVEVIFCMVLFMGQLLEQQSLGL